MGFSRPAYADPRILPAGSGAPIGRLACAAAAILLAGTATVSADEQDVVAALLAADRDGMHWPRPSRVEPALDLAGAYRVQSAYVRARLAGAAPDGYKAGLWTAAQQARYGLPEPVAGVLCPDGRIPDGGTVPADQATGLLVEAEIGWTLARTVDAPVPDAAAMAALVARPVAVLELPRVRFAAPEDVTGVDLVATDVASALHVVGPVLHGLAPEQADALEIVLRHDGAEVARARGATPAGSQMEALRWLVNRVLALGWPVGPGPVFITGTLAAPAPGAPGRWSAEYAGVRVSVRVPRVPPD